MIGLYATIFILMFLLIFGAPVVFAVALSAITYFVVTPGMWDMVAIYPMRLFSGMDSFVFLCIPLFVLAGEIMNASGMMNDLVKFCQVMVGRFKGGLAHVNILASMIFGGITGSGLADVSALGPIEIKLMKDDGYDPAFAAALTACSAVQGPIIPPSIPFVIFASLTSTSIGALFMAGAIPGIMIGLSQMLVVVYMSRKAGFPSSKEKSTTKEKITVIKAAFFALMMPIIILGGIISGIFTPTEASAVAVGYCFVVAKFYYKQISISDYKRILVTTAKTTGSIFLIIGFASVIGWVLAAENIPAIISQAIERNNISPYMLLFFVNVFFLFNGMWLSDAAQLVLFAPLFTPIFAAMGISPIHFGCVMVVNVMISMITPPYGAALYLAALISKEPLVNVTKAALPFIISSIVVLFLITYFPVFCMTLPKLMGLV
ncbi:MAG: TRAP transporter large permease [Synergistaceae bacterium]|nr:TRAP transporter large permease [Synergistaceae bacterium]